MAVPIRNGRPASEADIEGLERELGYRLPVQYRRFVAVNDGAEPDSNVFPVADNESDVRQFIPIRDINRFRTLIQFFPREFCPITYDEIGGWSFFKPNDPAVYFWHLDLTDESGVMAAPDFDTFLANLQPDG